ncbi:hypothetical protein KC644_01820 [Candidatus Berkelbacteria bacterium]|nr:hypothetical protein [Candidatus Berkelbacteria bacterium]
MIPILSILTASIVLAILGTKGWGIAALAAIIFASLSTENLSYLRRRMSGPKEAIFLSIAIGLLAGFVGRFDL